MDFVDVRLHLPVRPPLEYTVPDVGRTIKDCLLDDATRAQALARLEACALLADGVDAEPPPADDGGGRGGTAEPTEDVVVELRRAMSETVALVHEYLRDLTDRWTEHLTATKAHVTRIVRACDDERLAAERGVGRPGDGRGGASRREFHREIESIRLRLEASLRRVRETEDPRVERPERLTAACDRLREQFANAYGRVPTQKLLACKTTFEREIAAAQVPISNDFVGACTRLLGQ